MQSQDAAGGVTVVVIAVLAALALWVVPLATSVVGAEDAVPKAGASSAVIHDDASDDDGYSYTLARRAAALDAGSAVVHDDAGDLNLDLGGAVIVHDDAGNAVSEAAAAVIHDDAGNVKPR